MALAAPFPEHFIKAFVVFRDTSIFGACLAVVYGISLLATIMVTSLAHLPTRQRENACAFAPIILTTPFWASVIIFSSTNIPNAWISTFTMPFMEAIFWGAVAWIVFITAFTLMATLVCLVRFPQNARRDSDFSDCDLKVAEEAWPLTFEEALAVTSPPQSPQTLQVPRTPDTPFAPSPDSRPRRGTVTRCWHEPTPESEADAETSRMIKLWSFTVWSL